MQLLNNAIKGQEYSNWYNYQSIPILGAAASLPPLLSGVQAVIKAAQGAFLYPSKPEEATKCFWAARDLSIIFVNNLLNVITLGILNSALIFSGHLNPKKTDADPQPDPQSDTSSRRRESASSPPRSDNGQDRGEPPIQNPSLHNQIGQPLLQNPPFQGRGGQPVPQNPPLQNQGGQPLLQNPPYQGRGGQPVPQNPPLQNQGGQPLVQTPFFQGQGGQPAFQNPPLQNQGGQPLLQNPPYQGQGGQPAFQNPPLQNQGGQPLLQNPPYQGRGGQPVPQNPPLQNQGGQPLLQNPPYQGRGGQPVPQNPPLQNQGGQPLLQTPFFQGQGGQPAFQNPPLQGQVMGQTPSPANLFSPPPVHVPPSSIPSAPSNYQTPTHRGQRTPSSNPPALQTAQVAPQFTTTVGGQSVTGNLTLAPGQHTIMLQHNDLERQGFKKYDSYPFSTTKPIYIFESVQTKTMKDRNEQPMPSLFMDGEDFQKICSIVHHEAFGNDIQHNQDGTVFVWKFPADLVLISGYISPKFDLPVGKYPMTDDNGRFQPMQTLPPLLGIESQKWRKDRKIDDYSVDSVHHLTVKLNERQQNEQTYDLPCITTGGYFFSDFWNPTPAELARANGLIAEFGSRGIQAFLCNGNHHVIVFYSETFTQGEQRPQLLNPQTFAQLLLNNSEISETIGRYAKDSNLIQRWNSSYIATFSQGQQ